MFGWSITASAWRSASNRASTVRVSNPTRMSLSATSRFTGADWVARQTVPMPPAPTHSTSV